MEAILDPLLLRDNASKMQVAIAWGLVGLFVGTIVLQPKKSA